MPTLTDHIASWEEDCFDSYPEYESQDSISTEANQKESPAWTTCIDSLLGIWADPSCLESPSPNQSAIESAIGWIAYLKKRFPSDPPTCIIQEPDGGIIVERRVRLPAEHECLCELTFYNDGRAERTDFFDGRIMQMVPIQRLPQ